MPDTPFAEPETPPRARRGLIRLLLTLAVLAWALRSFVVAPFSIPSGSMLPTMVIGDYLFVTKWPYGFSRYSFPLQIPAFDGRVLGRLPERGDVVIFKRPDAVGANWVKRVIGLPGDTVSVSGGRIFLNGKEIARQSVGKVTLITSPNSPCRSAPGAILQHSRGTCTYPAFRETLPGGRSYLTFDQVQGGPGDDRATVTVPKDQLFLMGDNRDDSLDSRYALEEGGIGLVPVDRLVGRAAFAFWSTDGSASYWEPWTWISALRFNRIGTSYQP